MVVAWPARKEGALVSPLVRPAQDLNWLITNFVERVPSVAHAIVVSADGLPMAYSQGFPPDRVDQLAAVTSGLPPPAQGAPRGMGGGPAPSAGGEKAGGAVVGGGNRRGPQRGGAAPR